MLAATIIVLATVAAYFNSLAGSFVFDDYPSIRDNPSIHSLQSSLDPPNGGITVAARPVLNFTLAVNYALCGEHSSCRGYETDSQRRPHGWP
jgi:hypothetical protein